MLKRYLLRNAYRLEEELQGDFLIDDSIASMEKKRKRENGKKESDVEMRETSVGGLASVHDCILIYKRCHHNDI